jgi:hypothetical protein
LSERDVVAAVMSGDRPAHLDRCDICAERAVAVGRWLDDARLAGAEAADGYFTPERLQSQAAQIDRRIAQLEAPTRVLSFPAAGRADGAGRTGRRVAASWVPLAAAAGLVVGVVGGYYSARGAGLPEAAGASADVAATSGDAAGPARSVNTAVLDQDADDWTLPSAEPIAQMILTSSRTNR